MPSAEIAIRLATLLLLAARATAAAPLPAQADSSLAPGARVRVWVGPASAPEWRVGRLVALTSDSLVVERTDVLGHPRLALPLDSVRRLEVHSGGRARAAGIGCLAGGAAGGFLGASVSDPDSPGIGARFAVVGAGLGCAIGLLVGTAMGVGREWQVVPILRAPRSAPPSPPDTGRAAEALSASTGGARMGPAARAVRSYIVALELRSRAGQRALSQCNAPSPSATPSC